MKKLTLFAITCLSCLQLSNTEAIACKSSEVNNKNLLELTVKTGLTAKDIITYLNGLGYTVNTTPVQQNNNWTCDTHKSGVAYFTTVYTDGNNIITHEDIMI